jgi:hypothetical protein
MTPNPKITIASASALCFCAALFAAADARTPTFTRDVLPILQKSCQRCHRPGTPAPMSLLTYEEVRPWAKSIREKVAERYMPPWHIDRAVGEYFPDPSLSDQEIATLVDWVDGGAPRGKPDDAPPPRALTPLDAWEFGEPDLVVASTGVTMPADGPDLFTNVDVASGLTEDRYIRWVQVLPEDRKLLHHVLVYTIQDEPSNGSPVLDDDGSPVPARGQSLLIEHAVGNDGDFFPQGTGKLLKAGAKLRFSFHYHAYGRQVTDRTKIGFGFYPKGVVPKHKIITKGVSNREGLSIPPFQENVRSDSYFRLEGPAKIISFQPHMHFRGKRMLLEAILPDGSQRLLTDVARYTFNWQITYPYKNPPVLPKGSFLHVTAYHDNSTKNAHNPDASAWVGWGDRTVDEMNIGWTDFVYLTDEEYRESVKNGPRARVSP